MSGSCTLDVTRAEFARVAASDEKATEAVCARFPPEHSTIVRCLREVKTSLGREHIPYDISALMPTEWKTQRDALYQPTEVEAGVWIIPQWCKLPVEGMRLALHMTPTCASWEGMGTVDGLEHPATLLAVSRLLEEVRGGESVVDYGTGSGVLAIAALKLGAASAVGVDIDPVCVCTAARNMAANGVPRERFTLLCGGEPEEADPIAEAALLPEGGFGICVANMLEGHIRALSDRLVGYVRPGGTLLLSGMLAEQVECVMESFAPQIADARVHERGGWAAITARVGRAATPVRADGQRCGSPEEGLITQGGSGAPSGSAGAASGG
mmetsp:Transcript_35775/g.84810  ORF Transcript_35775/g.84810 Transcript_35775/m.84810 type:complete len:325 (+) Transcript_35775:730-1704(+)